MLNILKTLLWTLTHTPTHLSLHVHHGLSLSLGLGCSLCLGLSVGGQGVLNVCFVGLSLLEEFTCLGPDGVVIGLL